MLTYMKHLAQHFSANEDIFLGRIQNCLSSGLVAEAKAEQIHLTELLKQNSLNLKILYKWLNIWLWNGKLAYLCIVNWIYPSSLNK